MFELIEPYGQQAMIKVIGIGGGGTNAVRNMINNNLQRVDFICANTDAQALHNMEGSMVLQLGSGVTRGLGAGANPELGRLAAQEDRDRIREAIHGSDMLFITSGMGGGTGTGGAPVVAEIAKECGVLVVAVVTKPFAFEGSRRMQLAIDGIRELSLYVDSLITIPNEKLLGALGKDITMLSAFQAADEVLHNAVQGISELITRPGLINVDFADVRTVMAEMGMAMMGSGNASGEDRAKLAAESAVASPLLEDINLAGAKGILVNITASPDLGLSEVTEVGEIVQRFAADDAIIVVGTAIDPDMQDEIRVTVVATGLGMPSSLQSLKGVNTESNSVQGSLRTSYRPDMSHTENDLDYLDVPAFLRRQSD